MSTIDPRDEWSVRGGKVSALTDHSRLCERCDKEPREAAGVLCAGCLIEVARDRHGPDAFKAQMQQQPFRPESLRARCELLVQRWRQAAESGCRSEGSAAIKAAIYLQAAIALEEVLEETNGGRE